MRVMLIAPAMVVLGCGLAYGDNRETAQTYPPTLPAFRIVLPPCASFVLPDTSVAPHTLRIGTNVI